MNNALRVKRRVKRHNKLGIPIAADSGSECYFYNVGLKLYSSKVQCMKARARQLKAYKAGIAPFVFSNLIKVDKEYGYVTELARRCRKISDIGMSELGTKIRGLGWDPDYDVSFREDNVGYIGKKLVLIDFGSMTLGRKV